MAHIEEKTGRLIFKEISYPSVIQANYLADMQDEHRIDDIINIYTKLMPWNRGTPPCSHTEIGFWVDGELWFFSSTSRNELGCGTLKKNGTRWIKASDLLHNPDRWLLQEKVYIRELPGYDINEKIIRANDIIGLTYDFYGVGADFLNPFRTLFGRDLTPELIAKLKKIYCSKAVHLVDTGRLMVMSPKHRFKVAEKLGYVKFPDTEMFLSLRNVNK